METSPEDNNQLRGLSRKFWRTLGALALAVGLQAGDKAGYEGTVWVGPERLQDAIHVSAGRAVSLDNPEDVRIATYNLKGGNIDREGAIKTARSLGADVLGLTEAGDTSTEIAKDDYEIVRGGAGNVILSKFPILEHFSRPLPNADDASHRTALFAEIDLGETNQWFVLTHAEHNEWPRSAESTRLKQFDAIDGFIKAELDSAPILFGDLNFLPDSPSYKKVEADYDDTFQTLGIKHLPTFDGMLGLKRYDYIFLPEGSDLDVIAGGRLASNASDHDPIMVVVRDATPETTLAA